MIFVVVCQRNAELPARASRRRYPDGCTTKLTGTNGAGLWLFSRKPIADPADIETMRRMLVDAGYTLSQLLPVPQDGCSYDGAFIKPDVY